MIYGDYKPDGGIMGPIVLLILVIAIIGLAGVIGILTILGF
jgi:hypothetical protein